MREIKFRVWSKEKKVMGVLNSLHFDTEGKVRGWVEGEMGFRKKGILINFQPDEVELMQFTGLKDKNGKGRWGREIYEGDIVEDEKNERYEIVYQEEWGCFIADQGDGGLLLHLAKDEEWADDEQLLACKVKVIGNIYEGLYSGEKYDKKIKEIK